MPTVTSRRLQSFRGRGIYGALALAGRLPRRCVGLMFFFRCSYYTKLYLGVGLDHTLVGHCLLRPSSTPRPWLTRIDRGLVPPCHRARSFGGWYSQHRMRTRWMQRGLRGKDHAYMAKTCGIAASSEVRKPREGEGVWGLYWAILSYHNYV
ncbi:hypothetical protein BDN67DRAFT_101339 [Paxillus ammoniavirescens]|nr:hypothetical protein BDN67DRAFT_101339 [Paxillus ammoniavirescens]